MSTLIFRAVSLSLGTFLPLPFGLDTALKQAGCATIHTDTAPFWRHSNEYPLWGSNPRPSD